LTRTKASAEKITGTVVRRPSHGRPALDIGTHGKIFERRRGDRHIAETRFRDLDGRTRKVQRSGPNPTRARARLLAHLRDRAELGDGNLLPTSRFEDAAAVWLRELEAQVAANDIAPTTLAQYRYNLERRVLPELGRLRLQEVRVSRLKTFLASRDLGPNSKRQLRAVLSGVMQVAVEAEAVPANPVRNLGTIKGGAKTPVALSVPERDDLFAALGGDERARRADLIDPMWFMALTGCRIGEVLGTRWCDLDLVGIEQDGCLMPVLHVTGKVVQLRGTGLIRDDYTKTRTIRTVPLPMALVDRLALRRERLGDLAADGDPVFASGVGGYRSPHNFRRSLRAFCDRLERERLVPHTLRKTVATILKNAGMSSIEVADQLGHANVGTTEKAYYGRNKIHRQAATVLDRTLR
jgi:integrase